MMSLLDFSFVALWAVTIILALWLTLAIRYHDRGER
jgi:hypothetical protein